MWMVGVKPVPDSLGRVNKLELISLEELGTPYTLPIPSEEGTT